MFTFDFVSRVRPALGRFCARFCARVCAHIAAAAFPVALSLSWTLAAGAGTAWAQDTGGERASLPPAAEIAPNLPFEPDRFGFHAQTTYVWQSKPAFSSPYAGPNSLVGNREKSYSWTVTLDLGVRLWQGAEFHFNPELTQGLPFSGLHGLGALTNGELAKVSGTNPTVYRARAFLQQTWGLGGGTEEREADFNQFAGTVDKRRVTLTAGNFSVLDVFDQVSYSHDPRTQFLNWAFLTHGSFDYPADARGYTWGAALEYIDSDWAVRLGHFLQPVQSNGLALDTRMFEHYGDILEFEKSYALAGRPGVGRLMFWRNKARMGSFGDALALGQANGTAPDVADVRKEHAKLGVALSFEQEVSDSLGVFTRMGMSDDRTETYAFTEIGRHLSLGGLLKGQAWGRPRDVLGFAAAVNWLGNGHRNYLAAGGSGAFLGDGRLNYGSEQIFEVFYSVQLGKFLALSPDFQFIRNPGYNRDRGPVKFYGVRVHAEF